MWGRIVVAGLLAVTATGEATAQAPRRPVQTPVVEPAGSSGPEFRDPKTGKIWTPENVGQDKGPVAPSDRAFDPRAQAVVVEGVVEQRADAKVIDTIPVTAGPTVPLVEIDNPSLRAIIGSRWQVVLYLNNNSASTMAPVIDCVFTNGGRKVEETRALLPPTPGGTRSAVTLYGPRSEIYVDLANCRVAQP